MFNLRMTSLIHTLPYQMKNGQEHIFPEELVKKIKILVPFHL